MDCRYTGGVLGEASNIEPTTIIAMHLVNYQQIVGNLDNFSTFPLCHEIFFFFKWMKIADVGRWIGLWKPWEVPQAPQPASAMDLFCV